MPDQSDQLSQAFELSEGERLSVVELYQRTLTRRGYQADVSQLTAVKRLQQLHDEWSEYKQRRRTALRRLLLRPPLPRGVYLWGSVGRGKSFLMDSFYLSLPLDRKCRVHFHHFMRDVHRELESLKGTADPLAALAERIAERYRLICFDEMHVNDIADAMILGRLLKRTMDKGVVFCMTSNYHPDDLYKDGLKRDNFMPTIALIKERLDIINVDGGVDYRRRALEQVKVYLAPLGEQAEQSLAETFSHVAEVADEHEPLEIEGRPIAYRHLAGGVVWFDFMDICGWGRSQLDYLELSRRFHTVIVSNVPRIGLSLVDEGRRFTLMVDVFYDNRVKLILSADSEPEHLLKVEEGAKDARIRAMAFEFERTASRLIEMQSREYLGQQRLAA
jgi:cell division protein ZapE